MKLLLICLLMVSSAFAGMGKIAGRVLDENGDVAIGVGVLILETGQGVNVFDPDSGRFEILNITQGIYTVKVYSIGFETQIFDSVRVFSDLVTQLSLVLHEVPISAIELKIAYGGHPPIQRLERGEKGIPVAGRVSPPIVGTPNFLLQRLSRELYRISQELDAYSGYLILQENSNTAYVKLDETNRVRRFSHAELERRVGW